MSITAGDVAEMAFAILSSAGSLHQQMSGGDMSKAGYWFRGGHPLEISSFSEDTDIISFLLDTYTGDDLDTCVASWQQWVDDKAITIREKTRRLLQTNVFGAFRMLFTLDTCVFHYCLLL